MCAVVWRNACQLQAEVRRALHVRGAGTCAHPIPEAVAGSARSSGRLRRADSCVERRRVRGCNAIA
eukprot:7839117-Pyramimonas_sp.AAC.1